MNDELRRLFEADQGDRESDALSGFRTDPDAAMAVFERDRARRVRVAEILDAGGAETADDYYWAAMVFQHGDDVASPRRAHELALRALSIDPAHEKARWLAAAAMDRELVRRGQLQRYGTQFFVDDEGRWSLSPFDPAVTDEERARWNVRPLAEALRLVDENNRKK